MSRGTTIRLGIPASWATRPEFQKLAEEGQEIVPLAILDDPSFDVLLGPTCQHYRLADVFMSWLRVIVSSAARLKRQRQKEAKK